MHCILFIIILEDKVHLANVNCFFSFLLKHNCKVVNHLESDGHVDT